MIFPEFDKLTEEIFDKIRDISATKGKEYAPGDDRLGNFKRAGEAAGIRPEQALWVFLDKHLQTISYYCKNERVESESIEGRLLDAVVYLILLWGLVAEKGTKFCETCYNERYSPKADLSHLAGITACDFCKTIGSVYNPRHNIK